VLSWAIDAGALILRVHGSGGETEWSTVLSWEKTAELAPDRGLDVIYDGRCRFCIRSLTLVRRLARRHVFRFHDANRGILRVPADDVGEPVALPAPRPLLPSRGFHRGIGRVCVGGAPPESIRMHVGV